VKLYKKCSSNDWEAQKNRGKTDPGKEGEMRGQPGNVYSWSGVRLPAVGPPLARESLISKEGGGMKGKKCSARGDPP